MQTMMHAHHDQIRSSDSIRMLYTLFHFLPADQQMKKKQQQMEQSLQHYPTNQGLIAHTRGLDLRAYLYIRWHCQHSQLCNLDYTVERILQHL